LLGIGVQDDVVERLRIAIEDGRDDAVTGRGDAVTEDPIDFTARKPQQTCQRSVSGLSRHSPSRWKMKKSGVDFDRAAGFRAR